MKHEMENERTNDHPDRVGYWQQTYTGRKFWPADPRPEDVCIEDIAHSLSLICRFNGHCRSFYSVAEHSILVSRLVPEQDALAGLLHDAAEAYVGDMARPLKKMLPDYANFEAAVHSAIMERVGLGTNLPASVKEADNRIIDDERRHLLSHMEIDPGTWGNPVTGFGLRADEIGVLSPYQAEQAFLEQFHRLTGQ